MSHYTGIVNIKASGKKADVVAFDSALNQAYSNVLTDRNLIGAVYHDGEMNQSHYNKSAYAPAPTVTFLLSDSKQSLKIQKLPSFNKLTVEITLTAHRKLTADDYTHNSIPLTIEGFEEYFKFINGDQVERVIQPSKHYMPSHASHTFTRDSLNDLLGVHLTEDEFYNQLLVKRGGISDV
jgi:hypothetical protein